MTYYILLQKKDTYTEKLVGPYRSFMTADKEARAWNGINGWSACVLPLTSPNKAAQEI